MSEARKGRRRRGPELEAALLEAAWEELVAVGFAGLTMESVAARAHTGVAVLYRRWANKGELVLAALAHQRDVNPVELPDTGSLRGDLLGLLAAMGNARTAVTSAAVAAGFTGLLADTGLTPAQARKRILGDQPLPRVEAVYRRAHERGEIDLDDVPPSVLRLPFDLVRHDMVMNLRAPSRTRLEAIVDELFLPLATGT